MAASGHVASKPARQRKNARRARRSAQPSRKLTADAAEQLAQSKLDALEAEAPGELGEGGQGDDEYEFEDDFDDDESTTPRTRRGGGKSSDAGGSKPKVKRARVQGPAPHVARALGHRKPQRLADMLLADGIGGEESGASSGAVAAASSSSAAAAAPDASGVGDDRPVVVILGRKPTTAADASAAGISFLSAGKCMSRARPRRKFCSVTGLPALHREPRSHKRFLGAAQHARLVEGTG